MCWGDAPEIAEGKTDAILAWDPIDKKVGPLHAYGAWLGLLVFLRASGPE
jgi:hypothetical protein